MAIRKIIQIDEGKCNGCGLCVPSCAEGALQIIDGKARLVKDQYCDGLGACLGECPQGALKVIEREAPDFDEVGAIEHVAGIKANQSSSSYKHHSHHGGGCPGSRMMVIRPTEQSTNPVQSGIVNSELSQWPVQLHLVPIRAPFFQNADLIVTADCVAFAYGDFHCGFLKGKAIAIACPKLDDTGGYLEKLTEIIKQNNLKSISVIHMEVPCCFGLVSLVTEAVKRAGVNLTIQDITISINGAVKPDCGGDS